MPSAWAHLNKKQIGREVEMSEEQKKEKSELFGHMVIPTAIYAFVYTLCMYDNFGGILMGVFAIATIVYCLYVMKQSDTLLKRDSWLYMITMVLLGISNGLTGDYTIIFFNTLFIFVLIVVLLLHNYFDDSEWGPLRYLLSILTATIESISCLSDLFSDASCYAADKENEKKKGVLGVFIGLAISVPLLIIIIALLYSADIVFASILRDTFHFSFATAVGVVLMLVFAFLSAYCGTRFMRKSIMPIKDGNSKLFEPVVAITTLSITAVVYLFFSVIQIVYLFIGNMTLPDGYTYAQYAREGFFELLAVCVINVLMVLFVMAKFKENRFIKILLTVISLCTYIMIASSALRMVMYIEVYHLSRLRIMVLWGLITIAILLVGIMIAVYSSRFPLFKYSVAVISIAYLVLSFGHMDYFIASYNLTTNKHEYTEEEAESDVGSSLELYYDEDGESYYTNYYDEYYLTSLSTDAAAAFRNLPDSENATMMKYVREKVDYDNVMDDSIRQFNVSHEYFRRVFADEIMMVENSH